MGEEIQASVTIQALTQNLRLVREFMTAQVKRSALADLDKNKVVLAVDEAVANIVKHAYEGGGEGTILIKVLTDDTAFKVSIYDSGIQFDPSAIKDPDMKEHIRLGKKTGLGIFLMRQIMDEIVYSFQEGKKNELHLVRYIQRPIEDSTAAETTKI